MIIEIIRKIIKRKTRKKLLFCSEVIYKAYRFLKLNKDISFFEIIKIPTKQIYKEITKKLIKHNFIQSGISFDGKFMYIKDKEFGLLYLDENFDWETISLSDLNIILDIQKIKGENFND